MGVADPHKTGSLEAQIAAMGHHRLAVLVSSCHTTVDPSSTADSTGVEVHNPWWWWLCTAGFGHMLVH